MRSKTLIEKWAKLYESEWTDKDCCNECGDESAPADDEGMTDEKPVAEAKKSSKFKLMAFDTKTDKSLNNRLGNTDFGTSGPSKDALVTSIASLDPDMADSIATALLKNGSYFDDVNQIWYVLAGKYPDAIQEEKKCDGEEGCDSAEKPVTEAKTDSKIKWVHPGELANSVDNTETIPSVLSELIDWAKAIKQESMKMSDSVISNAGKFETAIKNASSSYVKWLESTEKDDNI